MKYPTSFRLQPETISLLKQLAQDESRSITNMVESLIKEKAKEKERERETMCRNCNGSGQFSRDGFDNLECPVCDGFGRVHKKLEAKLKV